MLQLSALFLCSNFWFRIQYSCYATIRIPVVDDDGDTVRCRWSTGSECVSICNALPSATIDSVSNVNSFVLILQSGLFAIHRSIYLIKISGPKSVMEYIQPMFKEMSLLSFFLFISPSSKLNISNRVYVKSENFPTIRCHRKFITLELFSFYFK